MRRLFADGVPSVMESIVSNADNMASKPIVTVNLWYDRQVMQDAFVGLPGRTMQWVFDKRIAFGESASHLSLVASGANAIVGETNETLARLAAAEVAPLATVNGNHDLRLGDEFAQCARRHGIRLLHEEPLELDGVAVVGVGVGPGPRRPQYVGRLDGWGGEGLLVVASHFPLLSEASRVAAAGLPYAGDLVNRADVEQRLRADERSKVVVSAHIHARCSAHDGPLLQFTVGALIEPPFDATIVELDPAALRVRRTARRLGEIAEIDPVFAGDDERWQRIDGRWDAVQ
jgi:hypothetical protein